VDARITASPSAHINRRALFRPQRFTFCPTIVLGQFPRSKDAGPVWHVREERECVDGGSAGVDAEGDFAKRFEGCKAIADGNPPGE